MKIGLGEKAAGDFCKKLSQWFGNSSRWKSDET